MAKTYPSFISGCDCESCTAAKQAAGQPAAAPSQPSQPPQPPSEEPVAATPLTTAQWEKMSEKAQWDIKVALRGPDSYYGETLKWYTTGVIRGRCRKVFRVGGSVNQDLRMVVLPDDRYGTPKEAKKIGKLAWNATHFLEHIEAAANWLNIPILRVPTETWHEAMQMSNTVAAGQTLIQAAEAPDRQPQTTELAELKRHLARKGRDY